ncbi:unnamed protein product [Peronospora destructor]|uniref:RxLR effector PexRD54 WY domain-containing protein n=1 Tax=Peronospora destructor TaxID=86335 RepID=A0AAV0SZS9_9STRA|nr:unnamed protein product [Peronospora destructor]
MRVPHVKFFLAAVAIAHATQAKITASVAVNTTHSDTESSSSAGRDKEVRLNTLKSRAYTANRDDGERMNNLEESTSKVAETIKNSVIPRFKNVFAKKNLGEYEKLLMIAKQPKGKGMKKLMKNYKDKRIAELIVHAKMERKHKGAALKLEKAQMNYWLDKKKSAKDVFELLELNEAGEILLVHPLYSYWSTYVEKFNKRYPLKKVSVVDFLTPTYYDHPALAHLIVNGKKHEFSQSAALQLEREQHTKWMGQGFYPDEMIKFLTKEASKKKKTFENFLKNEVEKAQLETKSRVDELFVELKLNKVEDGLFTNPLFKFWRDCLEKFNAGKPRESQTSVVKSLQTIYGDEDLFYLLEAEQKITTSAEYAKKMEKDLFATWVVNKKPLDDVFKLLGFNRVGYELLEGPLEKFVKVATEVMLSKTSNIQTKEEAFVENEIRNGEELASHAGKLRSTKFEKGLFRLWFTYEKNPKEVFEMLFFKDDLVKILNDGGNLFEIPRFVTFLKYAEAYSGTKRLATAEELEAHVSSPEKRNVEN